MPPKLSESQIKENEAAVRNRLITLLSKKYPNVHISVPRNLVITERWLKRMATKLNLCEDGIRDFVKVFPTGMKLDRKRLVLFNVNLCYFDLFCAHLGIETVLTQAKDVTNMWYCQVWKYVPNAYDENQKKVANYIADYLGML